MTLEERFWIKVNKTNNIEDCWEWNAALRNGYGCIKYNGKMIDSHRLSWILANPTYRKLITKDFICHKCDNRKCVNPNHLFLGNNSINIKDCYDKGRMIMPMGNRFTIGEEPINKSYSKELLIEVLDYRKTHSNETLKSIAIKFGIKYQALRDALRKK